MYQLKAHFMPQLYWFGLIKVGLSHPLKGRRKSHGKKQIHPGNRFYLMRDLLPPGLVGGARHLQEGAALWNEIMISDFDPKILHPEQR